MKMTSGLWHACNVAIDCVNEQGTEDRLKVQGLALSNDEPIGIRETG